MNSNQLKRLLNLIKKTGDRLVVADKESDDIFVLMNLEDYEDLSDVTDENFSRDFKDRPELAEHSPAVLTDEEMVDEINSDIADWSDSQKNLAAERTLEDFGVTGAAEKKEDAVDAALEIKDKAPIKGAQSMPSLNDVLSDDKYRKREFNDAPRKGWVDEEDLSDVPAEEEEKFYLEPVA